MFLVKRVYDPPVPEDGKRILVDRLWPRGISKERLQMAAWLKDVAPSDALRQWFHHGPANWPQFQKRYFAELRTNRNAWQPLVEAARGGTVTLLFSARNVERNNATALKEFLENLLGGQRAVSSSSPKITKKSRTRTRKAGKS